MKIDTAAVQLAAADRARRTRATKFGVLSEAIDTYMTGLHLTPPEGVQRRVLPDGAASRGCRTDATIANPYYGREMLTCGSFR